MQCKEKADDYLRKVLFLDNKEVLKFEEDEHFSEEVCFFKFVLIQNLVVYDCFYN